MIKIILLEKVLGLGVLGNVVHVKSGYARNFLIPFGKAIIATDINIKHYKNIKYQMQLEYKEKYDFAKQRAKDIISLNPIIIKRRFTKNGKLFGSVNKSDLINYFNNMGVKIYRNEIIFDHLIRKSGEYNVSIKLNAEIVVQLLIKVISDS
ncbi:50S ribosomal protein L9 [Candidatus Purcelliella pentastirinorum]|uniref:50S ribosomal protein L9 n=1 Tax=Candidatus Purcelliella pentastirinorum TaxID=472834 RepID=UPI00237A87F3|nr:50S ribosomal protein L9 [Candidatus Purcelliella pentastirinorum]WDR80371.1 50S ribosomal protein L9 [Candidatus Purcelliella pentastirinorum]